MASYNLTGIKGTDEEMEELFEKHNIRFFERIEQLEDYNIYDITIRTHFNNDLTNDLPICDVMCILDKIHQGGGLK